MIYTVGEKKPIITHCLKCSLSYSEAEESDDIYYKGLCPCCQHKEKAELLTLYRKRFSAKSMRELTSESPDMANNRRNKRKYIKKRK